MRLNEAKAAYDAAAKKLLSYKEVIANILQYAVREFKDCSLKQIISCIDGEPEISSDFVDDEYTPNVDASGMETVSVNDGKRSFDINRRSRKLIEK